MVKIVQKENPVLREKAKEVPISEIAGKKMKNLISRMKTALEKEDDGVAIAAPQVGVPLRIFIVSGKAFALAKDKNIDEETAGNKKKYSDVVFINPKLTKLSKKRLWQVEGCLSLRFLYGKVKRAEKATVVGYDEYGKRFTRGASGLLAQIFQHETDHLDGILFTDKAKEVKNIPPEKITNG